MQVIRLIALLASITAPGLLITLALTKSYSKASLLSVPISAGMAYSFGNYSQFVGLPLNSLWLFGEILICGLVLLVLCLRHGFPTIKWSRNSLLLGATAFLVSALLFRNWHNAAGSLTQLLPNHDAMYHSYAIRNILNTHSNSVTDALQLFPNGAGTAASFYPLGLHTILSLGVMVSGLSINSAMNVMAIGIGICGFPFAIVAWLRVLSPRNSRVIFAAIPATLMLSTVFPLSPLSWGGMPAIVAMTLSPAIAAALVELLLVRTVQNRIIVALALVGIFSIHATELITVGILVLVALAVRGELKVLTRWCWSIEPLWIAGLSGFMLLPVVIAAGGGAAERSLSYQPVLDLNQTTGQFLQFSFSGFALPIAMVLTCIGLLLAHRYKFIPIATAYLSVGGLCLLAARLPENELLLKLTKPWYGQVLRLNYNVVYFAVPLIAVSIVGTIETAKSLSHRRMRQLLVALSCVSLVSASAVALKQNNYATTKLEESWYNGLIPVNQNSVAAFHWMRDKMNDEQYVMTDVDGVDGSTWMYALANVRPLMYGAITDPSRDIWRSTKTEILASIGQLESKKELRSWIRDHNVRFFYFDERTNAIAPNHTVAIEKLRTEKLLTEVYSKENAHVFEFKN